MAKFAQQTSVSAAKSREELEKVLTKYGVSGFQYSNRGDMAGIMFDYPVYDETVSPRQVRTIIRVKFILDLPDPKDPEFSMRKFRGGALRPRDKESAQKLHEQATRQRWRALLLVVKAKLEAVESGISTFENEFLAHIVLPSGGTVAEWLVPQLQEAYAHKRMPPLLPGASKG